MFWDVTPGQLVVYTSFISYFLGNHKTGVQIKHALFISKLLLPRSTMRLMVSSLPNHLFSLLFPVNIGPQILYKPWYPENSDAVAVITNSAGPRHLAWILEINS